jgi:hypothetical protein
MMRPSVTLSVADAGSVSVSADNWMALSPSFSAKARAAFFVFPVPEKNMIIVI